MNARVYAVLLALGLTATRMFAVQEHQHLPATPLGAAEAGHHACLDEERAALERGEGFGMALVADRNAYPGPRHVLELEAAQLAAYQKLRHGSHAGATTLR